MPEPQQTLIWADRMALWLFLALLLVLTATIGARIRDLGDAARAAVRIAGLCSVYTWVFARTADYVVTGRVRMVPIRSRA